jgi:hypothetical protein
VNTDPLQLQIALASVSASIPLTFAAVNLEYRCTMGAGLLTAGTYILTVSGLIAPASTSAKISLRYQRRIDSFVVLSNPSASTISYPALRAASTSTITLQSALFATEGLPQDLTFAVTLGASSNLNYNSTISVRLPSYYSVAGWNLLSPYCEVNNKSTPCRLSQGPYILELYNIPVLLQAGASFTFAVAGLTTPQAALVTASPNLKFFVGLRCNSADLYFC